MGEESGLAGLVRRDTLADQVAQLLIRSIVERKLRPGDELPSESQLSAQYGVSRPVAREALRHLAALNMIQLANGKLPAVKPLGGELLGIYFEWALQLEDSTFVELHELRRGVEGACALYAAERRTEPDVARLRALLEQMRREDDAEAFTDLDLQLHLAIAEAAHNRLLQHTVESIRLSMRKVIRTGLELMDDASGKESPIVRLRRAHAAIVEDIVVQDPEAARRRMDEHLRGAVANFVAAGSRPDPE
ncbi:MAG: FadR/GntR family transcriptional regulator [Candidatus Dormiibacterota bacterium]